MKCVEWEERARAGEPTAPVRARRVHTLGIVAGSLLAVVALAVVTAL